MLVTKFSPQRCTPSPAPQSQPRGVRVLDHFRAALRAAAENDQALAGFPARGVERREGGKRAVDLPDGEIGERIVAALDEVVGDAMKVKCAPGAPPMCAAVMK